MTPSSTATISRTRATASTCWSAITRRLEDVFVEMEQRKDFDAAERLQRLQDEAERLLTESPAERRSREEGEETNRRFASVTTPARAFWPTSIAKAADPVEPSPEVAARFAKNLRRCRERAGLSQEELGYRAQLHRTQVASLGSNGRPFVEEDPGTDVPMVEQIAAGEATPNEIIGWLERRTAS